jgi:cytochrome P450
MVGVDLTDLDNFVAGFPHHLFERHRNEAPVYWHEPTMHTPGGEGFWSVATHAETVAVQNDAVTFSSEGGGGRRHGGTLLQDLEYSGLVLNMMDDPRHGRIRRLVSTGLTPRMVRRLEDELRARTRRLLDEVTATVDGGEAVDVACGLAAELPMQSICILLGVPETDRHELAAFFEAGFDIREGDVGFDDATTASAAQVRMFEYAVELIAAKKADPTDDMLSTVVHATLPDVEPSELTDLELYAFFSLLFAAGADTTRNAISGGLLALAERPAELARLQADPDLLASAIEEILRWTSPSPSKRRTATCATELGDHRIEPGDKVLFWEASANRDEAVFDRPASFDVGRDPNPHVALGHGTHFCLGANLARLEMRVVFEELLPMFPTIELAAPVEWTRSNRHTGIRHLPLRLGRS